MKVTLKQLQVFVHCAKYLSVSQAAKACYMTQSGASIALAEFESMLGFCVFDRHGKKILLNEDGKTLLPKAIAILDMTDEVERFQSLESASLQGELRIGASTTIGNYILPRYLQAFNQQHPGVELICSIANTQGVVNDLLNFNLDIGFIEGEVSQSSLEKQHWMDDELVVFANKHNSNVGDGEVNPAELSDYHWVLRELGSGTRAVFDKAMCPQLSLKNVVTLGSSQAIKQFIQQGDQLGCLSRCAIDAELKAEVLKEVPVTGVKINRPLYQVMNKNKYQSRVLKLFLAFINKST